MLKIEKNSPTCIMLLKYSTFLNIKNTLNFKMTVSVAATTYCSLASSQLLFMCSSSARDSESE